MQIKQVARISGLPEKTIRFYEGAGLICPDRRRNGYRDFTRQDLHKLAFLGRARSLGFSLGDCRILLSLYEDRSRKSGDVKRIALSHLDEIRTKIADLRAMERTLRTLITHCAGDRRPDCPILDNIATGRCDEEE